VNRLAEMIEHSSEALQSWLDGFTLPTLCKLCNAKPSHWGYVKEYVRWQNLTVATLKDAAKKDPVSLQSLGASLEVLLPYDVMPGRFFRHLIGMFLAAQETEDLFVEHPQLASAIGTHLFIEDAHRLHLWSYTCPSSTGLVGSPGGHCSKYKSRYLWSS
jgi:hypothetical protein